MLNEWVADLRQKMFPSPGVATLEPRRCRKVLLRNAEPLEPRWLFAASNVRDLLYVRVQFADQNSMPESPEISSQITRDATAYLQKWSGNQMSFTVAIKDVVLPHPTTHYPVPGGRAAIARDALTVLHSQGYDTQGFEHRCFRYNGHGTGSVADHSSTVWLGGSSGSTLLHELGHTLGLNHSHFWNPSDNSNPFGSGSEVIRGDLFSRMGTTEMREWNAHQKWAIGHIGGSQVRTVNAQQIGTTTVTLSNHENVPSYAVGNTYLVRIPYGDNAIFAEYRGTAGGVLIHRANASRPVGGHLLDGNPITETASDAALRAGQSVFAPLATGSYGNIRLTVNSLSGDRASMTIAVVGSSPAPPTSITGTPLSGRMSLTWSAPASTGGAVITDYIVQFKSAEASTWLTFADGVSAATSTTVTGLNNGVAYLFRVAAKNVVGASSYSAISTALTPLPIPTTLQESTIAGRGQKQFVNGRLREVWGDQAGEWIDLSVVDGRLQQSMIPGRGHIQYQNGKLREVWGTRVGEWIDLSVLDERLQQSMISGRGHIQYQNGRLREVWGTQVGAWMVIR